MATDRHRFAAAAFLGQALSLVDEPAAIARDLEAVSAEAGVAVYAAEVESSVGPAAFLVYLYDFAETAVGPGRDRYQADLDLLETARARHAPGPRVVADAANDDFGFILATTPATYQVLTGGDDAAPVAPIAPDEQVAGRRQAAASLLRLLREAEQEAGIWLQADDAVTAASDAERKFTSEETELALFLLDDRSIRQLLHVLDRIIRRARAQAVPSDATPE